LCALLAASALLFGCESDEDSSRETSSSPDQPVASVKRGVAVSPNEPTPGSAISITFSTPYHVGDITPRARAWAEILTARHEPGAKGVQPQKVGSGDNYQVLIEGPWGPSCEESAEFALGYFADPDSDRLTVVVERLKKSGGPRGKSWCRGTYEGRIEFRQPAINFRTIPFITIGTFTFSVT